MYLSYGHMNLASTFVSANGSPPAETQFEVLTWTFVCSCRDPCGIRRSHSPGSRQAVGSFAHSASSNIQHAVQRL